MGSKVLAVIGARLNSSRLPGKQLLPLAGRPMMGHIVARLKTVPEIDDIVLATTDDAFNQPLCEWAASTGLECFAFTGDVNDLVGRVDAVVRKYDPDMLVYVCGDCPLVEPRTLSAMLQAMDVQPDADIARLTVLRDGGQTIHEGFDLYRRGFWNRIAAASTEPFEREHIGSVVHKSEKVTPGLIAWVEDDPVYSSLKHRISVDTRSDYEFMEQLYNAWYEDHEADTLVSLEWAIEKLRESESLRLTNQHVRQKKVGEAGLSVCGIAAAGKRYGRGHVTRMVVLLRAMQELHAADVRLVIVEDSPIEVDCQGIRTERMAPEQVQGQDFESLSERSDLVLIDLPPTFDTQFCCNSKEGSFKVVVDHPREEIPADLLFVPSFYHDGNATGQMIYGWSNYLVAKVTRRALAGDVRKVAVIPGSNMSNDHLALLAKEVARAVPTDVSVTWVGLAISACEIPELQHETWDVRPAIPGLAHYLSGFDMAVTAYGVSFFECLNMGLPTIVFNAAQTISEDEWTALKDEQVALLAASIDDVGAQMKQMMAEPALRQKLSGRAVARMPNDAGHGAANAIMKAYMEKKGEAG